MSAATHSDLIVDQFTRQAVPFSTAKTIADENALKMLVDISDASVEDNVLDVACGGGLVVCAFAQSVKHATGIDMTPAMIERARKVASDKGLANATFEIGNAAPLPYADASFDIVVSRFTFHHFQEPSAVLKEMIRVCKPGGRVLVCDIAISEDRTKADTFNRMELLRDPSHVRTMPPSELRGLYDAVGLATPKESAYELRDDLENLLGRSFPNAGDADKIRAMFRQSATDDSLGIPVRMEGERVRYAYPALALCSVKA